MRKLIFVFLFLILGFFIIPSDVFAATYTVTKTADTNDGTCDADCSLREAIVAANANAGADTVEFNIPTSDGGYVAASGTTQDYFAVTVSTTTLTLSDDSGVTINGYSQSGATRNTAAFGETVNTVLKIQVGTTSSINLFTITGDNNHITGLSMKDTFTGSLRIDTSSNNWIEGNFMGTDITGTTTTNWSTISFITNSNSSSNIIGTNGDDSGDVGERNIIMINTSGTNGSIDIASGSGNNTVISGNYFGVNKTGRTCGTGTMNRHHIIISGGTNVQIGTDLDGVSDSEEANIFACINAMSRANLRTSANTSGVIQGNYIGTNPQRDNLLSSFAQPGIDQNGTSSTWTTKRNIIAYNGSYGIGLATAGSAGLTISENVIYGNVGLNIDLGANGLTVNDPGDGDTGANSLMNYPVIEWAEYIGNHQYEIYGSLDANSSEGPFTIEVCKSENHPSGHGGCEASLGTMSLASSGGWKMTVTVSGDDENHLSYFSALATNSSGSTSEFGGTVRARVRGASTAGTPHTIDLIPYAGGVVTRRDVTAIVTYGTFKWDVYLKSEETPRTDVFRVPNTIYWQVSPRYDLNWYTYYGDVKILPSQVLKPFILVFKYNPLTMEKSLSEKRLKLAYSANGGKTWKLLNSVLDIKNKTVAVVTKNSGMYMLVSRY